MQTYTHLAIGGAFITLVAPHEPLAQMAFVVGSVAPDIPLAAQFVFDKIRRHEPMEESGVTLNLKEVSHSIPVWILLLIGFNGTKSPFSSAGVFLCAGILLHCFIDVLTHCGLEYRRTDQGFLWPLRIKLGSEIGLWEYRYGHGVLKPKPFEAFLLVLSLATWASSVLFMN